MTQVGKPTAAPRDPAWMLKTPNQAVVEMNEERWTRYREVLATHGVEAAVSMIHKSLGMKVKEDV